MPGCGHQIFVPMFRIAVLGSGSVGKSSLTMQYTLQEFVEYHDPTLHDVYRKIDTLEGEEVTVEITDTAGQDEYLGILHEWIRGNQGFVIAYSIANAKSLERAKLLYTEVERVKEDASSFAVVLIGNKCDLADSERKVSEESGRALAAEWSVPFFETSAKENINVTECMHRIIQRVKEKNIPLPSKMENPIQEPSKRCCTIT